MNLPVVIRNAKHTVTPVAISLVHSQLPGAVLAQFSVPGPGQLLNMHFF
jgi:hypothetical protein